MNCPQEFSRSLKDKYWATSKYFDLASVPYRGWDSGFEAQQSYSSSGEYKNEAKQRITVFQSRK